MAVVSSGEIKIIGDVNLEINGNTTDTDVSLTTLSTGAGFSEPHALTEFYGYTDAIAPTVATNTATSVGTSSMILNGNVTSDGGATVTSRGFYFGTSSTYTSNTKYTVGSGTGTFSTTRTGLSQNTTYYITAFAINSAGESVGTTISQKTSFNYTFKNNRLYQEYPSNGNAYLYYSNVNGGWINSASLTANSGSNQYACVNYCTNRQNRVYGYTTSAALLRMYKSQICTHSTTHSNKSYDNCCYQSADNTSYWQVTSINEPFYGCAGGNAYFTTS